MSAQQKRTARELRVGHRDVTPDNLERAEMLELRALRPLLDATFHLLGADHSILGDPEAEAAHQLVRVVLRRIDEAIREGAVEIEQLRREAGQAAGRRPTRDLEPPR